MSDLKRFLLASSSLFSRLAKDTYTIVPVSSSYSRRTYRVSVRVRVRVKSMHTCSLRLLPLSPTVAAGTTP